ncbi:MAG: TIGR00296 family protein [Candidatus Hydrothermarchaeota archaeon]
MSEKIQNFIKNEKGNLLVNLAKEAFIYYLKEQKRIDKIYIYDELKEKRGVFITLKKIERDREKSIVSMGYPLPEKPLFHSVIDSAIACANKARILNLLGEIESIILEVSVLGNIEEIQTERRVDYPKQIKLGQDGIMIERGFQRALILPQVPLENEWNEIDLLSECCLKAGLSPDAWLDEDTRIYKFKTRVFRCIFRCK